MPNKFLTPAEARVMLEWRDRRNAEIRAKAPPGCADLYARLFPPVSDEIFRRVMEMALLGECPDPRELPPSALWNISVATDIPAPAGSRPIT